MLFGGSLDDVDEAGFEVLAAEVPTTELAPGELAAGLDIVDLLVRTGLAKSKGDARRTLEQGGVYVDGEAVARRRPEGRGWRRGGGAIRSPPPRQGHLPTPSGTWLTF